MGNIMYNELKQNNNFNENENNIFTMAGRTCKEQQEFIEIYIEKFRKIKISWNSHRIT